MPYMSQKQEFRVLVIDDEKPIADTLAIILQSAGYIALQCYSASEALEAFEDFHPDLVLSDVVLGDGNGLDLAIEFRRAHPECRILLFSGQVTAKDLRVRAPEGCAFEFLSKPVHPTQLIAVITSLFEASLPACA